MKTRTVRRQEALWLTLGMAGLMAACGGGSDPAPASDLRAMGAAEACSALRDASVASTAIGLPTSGAKVTQTELVAASGSGTTAVGEYCKVTGEIAPVDRAAPPILFNVALPTQWNTKAMHLFGGGYDGTLILGSASAPGTAGLPSPLARGYAGFGSNGGHVGNGFDGSFALNDEALENELGDHLRKTRDVAVALIKKRYGAEPSRTYAAGGSGGGRQALYVADRWPSLYDGVISYYPARSLTAMLVHYTQISKALAVPGAWSNPAKQRLLGQAVTAHCDALDGVQDGIVSQVSACQFDPATLRCAGGADTGDACLSDAQIEGFRAYATPLTLPFSLSYGVTGYGAYNVFDSGMVTAMGSVATATPATPTMSFAMAIGEPFVRYYLYKDANHDSLTFNPNANSFTQQRLKYLSARQDINPDLSAFAAKGGKVLIVHGMTDDLIPASSSDEFYRMSVAAMGQERVNGFLKYYQVPGYAHGSGAFSLSFDSIAALEQWVEGGRAPSGLIGRDTNAGNSNRTRPLCEFGSWPRYRGTGDVNDASSFACTR